MENAADALKIAFAMLIFVIALSISISVYTQARTTADAVFYRTDITNFYDNVEASEAHKEVGMETIIPVIYRYALEDYAVTLIDNQGKVIARYSTATDSAVSNCSIYNNYSTVDTSGQENQDDSKEFLQGMGEFIGILKFWEEKFRPNVELNDEIKELGVSISYEVERLSVNDISTTTRTAINGKLNSLISNYKVKIYEHELNENGLTYYASPWSGSNKDIVRRIDADVSGKKIEFGNGTYTYEGVNLLEYYGNSTFTEYSFRVNLFTEEELESLRDERNNDDDDNNDDNIFNKDHIEIIYVQNQ